ncbi:MAG TPA: hypothetical protein VJT09_17505 [Pyrinomonadaceae bacterium]|nr:hypothetical protein [Pyrinomonadaceae bacterium]
MISTDRKKALILSAALLSMALATQVVSFPQRPLPNPVLYFVGSEPYKTGGKDWMRYKFMVGNYDAYPNEIFAPAPDLPPCGNNTKSSRTWVEVYDQGGKRLNGFCAFTKAASLNEIWFSLEPGVVPPSWVYIELNDRKTNTKYKSNLADTTE